GLICGPEMTCVGMCDVPMNPGAVTELLASPHPDEKEAHRSARAVFRVPVSPRPILRYAMRVSASPITDEESFERGLPAVEPSIENIELMIPVDAAAGERVEVNFGGLSPETHYWIAVRAIDECNDEGP